MAILRNGVKIGQKDLAGDFGGLACEYWGSSSIFSGLEGDFALLFMKAEYEIYL